MEAKYYTPDISEFHVGFEYERLYGNEWLGDDPFPEMAGDHCIENMESLIDKDLIRVKYLDKEDIESLGFKKQGYCSPKNPNGKFTSAYSIFGVNSKGEQYGATIFFDNLVDNTFIKIDYQIAPGAVYGHIGSTVFKGNIKNKSELNKLLKQLRINNNE